MAERLRSFAIVGGSLVGIALIWLPVVLWATVSLAWFDDPEWFQRMGAAGVAAIVWEISCIRWLQSSAGHAPFSNSYLHMRETIIVIIATLQWGFGDVGSCEFFERISAKDAPQAC